MILHRHGKCGSEPERSQADPDIAYFPHDGPSKSVYDAHISWGKIECREGLCVIHAFKAPG